MNRKVQFLIGLVLMFLLCETALSQSEPPSPAGPASSTPGQVAQAPAIQTSVEEVLLDAIVRDRHGKMVHDLRPDQIQVLEDGIPQTLSSFRLVEGSTVLSGAKPSSPEAEVLRGLSLVTLVFERLDQDSARLARQAALDFLDTEKSPRVFMAVFTIDQRLYVVQPFTNDHALLRKAIEQATRSSATQLAAVSDSIQERLENAAGAANAANQNLISTVLSTGPGSRAAQGAMIQAIFARMTADMLLADEALTREQEGRTTFYSLISLVKEQRRLPGRKTVLYVTRGLEFTREVRELLRATVSEANRANVSFYAVDARGLSATEVMNPAVREIYRGAESSSHNVLADLGAAAQVASDPRRDVSLVSDPQAILQNLAEDTGGFLLANSNDLRVGLRRVAEEIDTYYELTYRPPGHAYDGKFHTIEVKALRPGLSVQSRSGYYAFPPMGGSLVFAYEVPLLEALAAAPATTRFDYHAAALHFGFSPQGLQYQLLMEVPLSLFTFAPDEKDKLYRAHFSLLALVKNSQAQVLQKFSRDFPLDGPLEKLDAVKTSELDFKREFRLPPGRYTLETAVYDWATKKASLQRYVLVAPSPPEGIAISSVTVVRRAEPLASNDPDTQDPLRYQALKIVPNLDDPIRKTEGAGVPLYFVVYPQDHAAEAPQAELELVRSGEVIARSPVQLPPADARGQISYAGTLPVEKFPPGRYEVRALVRQGSSTAVTDAYFTLTP